MAVGAHPAAGGHAMFYLIEKYPDHSYAFTVINTGAGIDYHSSQVEGYKTKHRPIFKVKNITPDSISNPKTFLSLMELKLAVDERGISWGHRPSDIYERILPALKGERDETFENQADWITDQRSGTCSWKSLMKLLQLESLDRRSYKSFNFDLRRDSLVAYFQKSPLNDAQIQLLKRSTESFARLALKLYKDEIIDKQNFKQAEQLCRTILKSIEEKESILAELTAQSLQFDQAKPSQMLFSTDVVIPSEFKLQEAVLPGDQLSLAPLNLTVPKTLSQMNVMLTAVNSYCFNPRFGS